MKSSVSPCLATTLVVAMSITGVVAACGGSDDPPASGGPATAESVARTVEEPAEKGIAGDSTSRQRAHATVRRFYAAMEAGDADAVCIDLTEKVQVEISAPGATGDSQAGCVAALEPLFQQFSAPGGVELRSLRGIKQVKFDGQRALARATFNRGKPTDIPLEHSRGDWRVASLGVGGE